MTIATWNVNGIRARHEQVIAWIAENSPDVLCLQETKAPAEKVPAAIKEIGDYWSYWHGFKGYSGVALLIKKLTSKDGVEFLHPSFDMENRIVMAKVGKTTVVSVYVPNGGKNFEAKMDFLAELDAFVADHAKRKESLVICGDINIARTAVDVHPSQRREVIGQLPIERSAFEKILSYGMVDIGREVAPDDERLFTWWAPWRGMREKNMGWRLDYILADRPLAKKLSNCGVDRLYGTSDHAPVVARFSV